MPSCGRFSANSAVDHELHIQFAPVNLPDLVLRVVAQHLEAAGSKDISICTVLADHHTGVLADAHALTQVLDNLISNAIKFSPLGGDGRRDGEFGGHPHGMPDAGPGRRLHGRGQGRHVVAAMPG